MVDGYWHGMLLVPESKRDTLLDLLEEQRNYIGYSFPLSFKDIKDTGKKHDLAKMWVHIAVASLIHDFKNKEHRIYYPGKRLRGGTHYDFLDFKEKVKNEPIACKFILFREMSGLKNLSPVLDYGAKVETTCRMGLKGGLNLFSNSTDNIEICNIHFDGHKHYKRNIDKNRLLGRLSGLKDNIVLDIDKVVLDDRSSDYRRSDSQDYDDCQFLQLIDFLVSSSRIILGDSHSNKYQTQIAQESIKSLIDKFNKGRARMEKSRWNNSFCLSQCFIDNEGWCFKNFDKSEKQNLSFDFFK